MGRVMEKCVSVRACKCANGALLCGGLPESIEPHRGGISVASGVSRRIEWG